MGQLFLALRDDMRTPVKSRVQVQLFLSGEAADGPHWVRLTGKCPGRGPEPVFADLGCHSDSDSQVFGRKLTPPPPGGVAME